VLCATLGVILIVTVLIAPRPAPRLCLDPRYRISRFASLTMVVVPFWP